MIQISQDSPEFVTIHMSGRVDRADYEKAVPEVEELLASGRKRWLIELDDLHGMTPGAFIEELRFNVRHRKDFERVAVIESHAIEGLGVNLVKPFFSGEVKVFKQSDREAAKQWMRKN
jgi:hypothetical protein